MDQQEINISNKIEFKRNKYYPINELDELFQSIKWESANIPEVLQEAFIKSTHVIGAYYCN